MPDIVVDLCECFLEFPCHVLELNLLEVFELYPVKAWLRMSSEQECVRDGAVQVESEATWSHIEPLPDTVVYGAVGVVEDALALEKLAMVDRLGLFREVPGFWSHRLHDCG